MAKTSRKLSSVGGFGMKIGGKAVLSASFFKDRDSIHKNTRIAGETSARTERANPTLPAMRLRLACARHGSGIPFRALARMRSKSDNSTMMMKNTTTSAEA